MISSMILLRASLSLETRDAFATSLALLKRNVLAAPFERAFNTRKTLENSEGQGDLMQVHYRDEEAMYIQAASDRVTVIFSTIFREETDRIFGKVFLQVLVFDLFIFYRLLYKHFAQEFVDARRQPSIQTAPQVLYSSRDPPLEIRDVPGLRHSDEIGYVTFILFPRHFANSTVASASISHIQLFRDYLHYHIKCSKAYMHSRMRHRVTEFQKVLNRAKMEGGASERKTARWVNFVTCYGSSFLLMRELAEGRWCLGNLGPCRHVTIAYDFLTRSCC